MIQAHPTKDRVPPWHCPRGCFFGHSPPSHRRYYLKSAPAEYGCFKGLMSLNSDKFNFCEGIFPELRSLFFQSPCFPTSCMSPEKIKIRALFGVRRIFVGAHPDLFQFQCTARPSFHSFLFHRSPSHSPPIHLLHQFLLFHFPISSPSRTGTRLDWVACRKKLRRVSEGLIAWI